MPFPDFNTMIYEYHEPSSFLNAVYLKRKEYHSKFSLRAWARELGLKEATPLTLAMKGKRNLPLRYLPILKRSLKLDSFAVKYLKAITQGSSAATPEIQDRFIKISNQIVGQKKSQPQVVNDFELFSDPLFMLLLNLVDLPDFKMEMNWISRRIRSKAEPGRIAEIYRKLIESGYLMKMQNGSYRRSQPHLTSTSDIPSLAVRQFHEASLKSAISSLHLLSSDEREFGSYFFTARMECLPEIKMQIRNFLRTLIALYSEGTTAPDTVFQVNLNLISKTQLDEDKKT